jgi:hypothetical protein
MAGSTIYATQKTREAVNCLALQDGPLRERLSRAAFALHILQADKIPDDNLHEKLEAILAKIYDGATPDNYQLSHLTDDEVSAVARSMVELFECCVALYTKSSTVTASS